MDPENRHRILKDLGPLSGSRTGSCSFCGVDVSSTDMLLVRSNLSGKAVCYCCLMRMYVRLGFAPEASVVCLSCKQFDGFVVTYDTAVVEWALQTGPIDNVYNPVHVKGQWMYKNTPKKVECVRCHKAIPLVCLGVNPSLCAFLTGLDK